jgi:hypothetical protein
MSRIRGRKPHRANTIIPIAGTTSEVAGFESNLSHDLSRQKKEKEAITKMYELHSDVIYNEQ